MNAASSSAAPVSRPWDVIIIGGGPAGSSAATALAKAGRRALVLEKAKFPRFHVGESLLPYNKAVFEKLGVWDKLMAAGFMRKRGAQFLMGNGSHKVRLDFSKGSFTKFPEAIQVERSKFDDILLRHSRECGAEVREESTVLEHSIGADGVTVRYRDAAGAEHSEEAAFLIDASGLTNFTANKEGAREFYTGHKKVAVFSHYHNVEMPRGEEEGDILIVRRRNSWMWLIPLSPEKTSVGLVMDHAEFRARTGEPGDLLEAAIRDTAAVTSRFAAAERVEQVHTAADFSYRNGRLVAPRLVRAGDAGGFIDPIFSSGVMLATNSGLDAGRIVDEALTAASAFTPAMRRYEKTVRVRIGLYWRFIEKFYQPHFARLFFQPHNRLRMVCAINAVLAGLSEPSAAIRWRLHAFFLLARLNRHIPVTEKIEIS